MEALTISDIAPDGRGIAIWKKRPVYIADTIPGEVVHVRIMYQNEDYIEAEVESFEEVSTDRVAVQDEGCTEGYSWQHIAYEAQLALKADIITTLLEVDAKIKNPSVAYTLASPEQWGYARRLSLYPMGQNGEQLGILNGDLVRSITSCATLHPAIMDMIEELNLALATISRLDIHTNDAGQRMLVLQTDDEEAPELEISLPASINFLLNHFEPYNLVGDTHITHQIMGRKFRITAGVQSRANIPQMSTLAELVAEMVDAQASDSILDVYGGIGTFSAALAPFASYITYIDSYPPAATDAEFNLADFDNVDIVEGRADVVLSDLADEEDGESYAAAVLDPPHHGLNQNVLKALKKLAIPRLLYVSDNPQLFAKDANTLFYHMNYKLVHVQPIDFAPQTPYFETVALFERR